jgi:hypothetical protein
MQTRSVARLPLYIESSPYIDETSIFSGTNDDDADESNLDLSSKQIQ